MAVVNGLLLHAYAHNNIKKLFDLKKNPLEDVMICQINPRQWYNLLVRIGYSVDKVKVFSKHYQTTLKLDNVY